MAIPGRLLRCTLSFRAARLSGVTTSRPVLVLPFPRARPFFRADASTSTSASSLGTLPATSRGSETSSTATEDEDEASERTSLEEVGEEPPSSDPNSSTEVRRGKGPKPPGPSRTIPKNRKRAPLPPLIESDLDETFVRGSGPGGQSINKTSISCSLIHRPSGIRVQCHETRSRELNRLKARRRMQEKLDMLYNPGESMLEKKWERERGKKEAKKRKGRRGKELPATGDAAVDRVDRDDSGDGGEDKGTAGAIV